jgi:hypothetical protein
MSTSLPSTDARLTQTVAAFAQWRSSVPRPSPIPAELWAQAVELATTLGASPVARALKLDYNRLKQHMQAGAAAPAPEPPAFVELSLGVPLAPRGCTLELVDGRGRSLRIEWSGGTPGELTALAERLWEATR